MELRYKSGLVESKDFGVYATLEIVYQSRGNIISKSERYLQSALAKHKIYEKSVFSVNISRFKESGNTFVRIEAKFYRIDLNIFPSVEEKIRAICLFIGIQNKNIHSIVKVNYPEFSSPHFEKIFSPECWIIRLNSCESFRTLRRLDKALSTLNIVFDVRT